MCSYYGSSSTTTVVVVKSSSSSSSLATTNNAGREKLVISGITARLFVFVVEKLPANEKATTTTDTLPHTDRKKSIRPLLPVLW